MTPNRHTYRILVVEDDPMVRRFIDGQLREQGYAVIEAASGEEAIALTSEHPPWIGTLFTNIQLGGRLNGWDVAEAFRQLGPPRRSFN